MGGREEGYSLYCTGRNTGKLEETDEKGGRRRGENEGTREGRRAEREMKEREEREENLSEDKE